jgi:hypothetical protein
MLSEISSLSADTFGCHFAGMASQSAGHMEDAGSGTAPDVRVLQRLIGELAAPIKTALLQVAGNDPTRVTCNEEPFEASPQASGFDIASAAPSF